MGHQQLVDGMIHDGLWDVYNNFHMGGAAELIAGKFKVTREDQDRYAFESHQKAVAAIEAGRFKAEIVPVAIPQKKGDPILFATDESPRRDTTVEKLATLQAGLPEGRHGDGRQRPLGQRRRLGAGRDVG